MRVPRAFEACLQLSAPGRYLVICGVLLHFQDGMHGYVNVVS